MINSRVVKVHHKF